MQGGEQGNSSAGNGARCKKRALSWRSRAYLVRHAAIRSATLLSLICNSAEHREAAATALAMALSRSCAALLLRRPCAALLRRRRAPALPPCAAGARCMAAGSPQEVTVVEDVFGPDAPLESAAPLPSGADASKVDGAAVRRYAHTMRSGRHTLRGDLMPAAGGFDAGPSPKELALLALGLCTSMTVRVFADNSRFALRRVGVTVRERCPPGAHVPEVRRLCAF